MAGPYRYIPGPDTLGIGVENMALAQPGLAQFSNYWSPRYNVRGDLGPYAPAFIQTAVEGPSVSLRGNGVYLSDGDVALQSLIEFNKGMEQ